MIVWLDPPPGAPATLAADARAVALRHPGEDLLKIRAGGHMLTIGDGVRVCRELVAELEALDFTVEIAA